MSQATSTVARGPILAIDFGTSTCAAVLVTDGAEEPIEEPSGRGRTWPSSVSRDGDTLLVGTVAERRKRMHPALYRAEFKLELGRGHPVQLGDRPVEVPELVTALLAEIRRAAQRVAVEPVIRAVLTVPAGYGPHDHRGALMIEAGRAAGFETVELLSEPVAAALAPVAGPPLEHGSLVLVYDFGGGTFDTALVRIGAEDNEVIGHAAVDCGGREIDAALYSVLAGAVGEPLEELLKSARSRLELTTQTVRLKHQLTDVEAADDYFGSSDILLTATREQLAELAGPFIDRTLDCVKSLLVACQIELDEVDAVLMAGGVTRMPVVALTVEHALGRPIRYARSPELAVVQGAARFARAVGGRCVPAVKQRRTERPLRWRIPGDSAELLTWHISRGEQFFADQPLAQVRLPAGAIWELRADADTGRVTELHAAPGATVYSGDWLATSEILPPKVKSTPDNIATMRHSDDVRAVAFNFNGLSLASVSDDRYVRFWNPANGSNTTHLVHPDWVYAVAFNARGDAVATGCRDGVARIIGVGGREMSNYSCDGSVSGVSFSPDGLWLATAGDHVQLWRIGNSTCDTLGSSTGAWRVAFTSDGRHIVVGFNNGAIEVWDAATQQLCAAFQNEDDIEAIALSPDDVRVAVTGPGSSIRVYDIWSGTVCMTASADGTARSVAFSSDGTMIATGSGDKKAQLWDASTGAELASWSLNGTVHAIAFDPSGTRVVTGEWGAEHSVRVWQIR